MSRIFMMGIVLLALAACNPNPSPTPSITAEATNAANNNSNAETSVLSETYTGTNELVNSSLSVSYPTGWTAQGQNTQLLLSKFAVDSTAPDALVITIITLEGETLPAEASPETMIELAALEGIENLSPINTAILNGRGAATAQGKRDAGDTVLWAIQFEESFVILTAMSQSTISGQDIAIIAAIASSINYQVGEIPQSSE